MAWTLEYASVEKTLAAWGIVDDLPFEFNSQAKSLVDIITTDDFDDAFQFAYEARIIIRRDRAGSGVTWARGSIWFQGYVADPRRLASGSRQNHRYTIYDWWWLAERTPLRRIRKSYTGSTTIFAELPPSEVVLFENQLEQPIDTQVQFLELLNLLNECWNATRRGATSGQNPALDVVIDGDIETDLQVPRYPVRDIMVSEAIQQVLAWTQDAVIETDYDSAIPIVSVRRLPNMPVEVVDFSDADKAPSLQLRPRHDLLIPGVILFWKKVHTQDGIPGLQYALERYPTDLSVWHPNVRMHTIDLLGSTQNTVSQQLQTLVVDANHATPLTRHTWWKKHLPWLDNAQIPQSGVTITDATITDRITGAAVSLIAFPYEVLDGAIAPWMDVEGKQVIIKARATYTVYANSANTIKSQKAVTREISTTITICDYDTDGELETFTTVAQNDPGEVVVFGLAQAVYETHQTLQHEGIVPMVAADVPDTIHLGQSLTVITPAGIYSDMLIQRVTGELTRGRIAIHVGPPAHLGIADMIELMRVNRYRTIFNLPSYSNNPLLNGANGIALGANTPKQDGTEGGGTRSDIASTSTFEG